MSRFTRGFTSRGRAHDPRLPPGQHDTRSSWPVLTAERAPPIDTTKWTFAIDGLVGAPTTWTWDEIQALPQSTYDGAIHCVTTWSKFDMQWRGVTLDTLLKIATPMPSATHIVAHSSTGYTTNLPLEDVTGGRAWVAFEVDGEPLSREHGGPARLLVPHLYFWKSAKFLSGITVLDHDEPGFWEVRGYHDRGDPWLEQRYRGD
jgi:DMSO/TMAO reductase YedYZ molybdopterin-dependent catalytic subunit